MSAEIGAEDGDTRERTRTTVEAVERQETVEEFRCRGCDQWFRKDEHVAGVEVDGQPVGNLCEACLETLFDVERDLSTADAVRRSVAELEGRTFTKAVVDALPGAVASLGVSTVLTIGIFALVALWGDLLITTILVPVALAAGGGLSSVFSATETIIENPLALALGIPILFYLVSLFGGPSEL